MTQKVHQVGQLFEPCTNCEDGENCIVEVLDRQKYSDANLG